MFREAFSSKEVYFNEGPITMETQSERMVGKEQVRDQAEGSVGISSVKRRYPASGGCCR